MLPTKQSKSNEIIIDIPAFHDLSDLQYEYFKKTTDASLQIKLFKGLIDFLDFCIQYADAVFKGKKYTFDHIAPQLFVTKIKADGQFKSYLRNALYASMLYAKKLRDSLKKEDIINCEELILTLLADYEWLLANYDNECCGNSITKVCHSSRRSMDPMDLKWSANQLMFLEQTQDLKNVDYRNVKPAVMFVIRQCLEVLGKNLIGFDEIVDANGKPIHQFTQVSWTFLHEMEKQNKNVVSLPLKAVTVEALNSWTNSYVHNPVIYACYVQFYALEMLYEFSQPAKRGVKTYDGKCHSNMTYGKFIVPSYSVMKQEFEGYIHQTRPKLTFKVNWLQPEEVGAYILAL
jgi:hypothetical protein